MSDGDGSKHQEAVRPDFTLPIARSGEQQFAAIVRNRSGMDAGELDFGVRSFSEFLHPSERQKMSNTAYALYESVCEQTGVRATRELAKLAAQSEGDK